MISVVLVDDHTLLRNGLSNFIKSVPDFTVPFEASNGKELQDKLTDQDKIMPDVVLMDINMPVMDGYNTTKWLKRNYPAIKVLALSMYDDELCIIRMLQCGAKGYILKDADPQELVHALKEVYSKGFYHGPLVIKHLSLIAGKSPKEAMLTKREIEILQYMATDMTYKEIAEQMNVGFKTVEGYKEKISEKLAIKTRVGLVLFAIRNGIVQL